MKYKIEGINDGKIIDSVKKVNGSDGRYILVNYLDGTQDVFPFNDNSIESIKSIMDTQAEKYVSTSTGRVTKLKIGKMLLTIFGTVEVLGLLGFIFFKPEIIVLLIFLALASAGVIMAIKEDINNRLDDVEKYGVYVKKLRKKLEDYNEIIKKEKMLSKDVRNIEMSSILELDNVSLDSVNQMVNKVERYQEVEGKRPKIKTFENSRNV